MPQVDAEQEAAEFWRAHGYRQIKKWYLKMKRPSDVISTASPEFFVQPLAKKLGVQLLGSQVDPKTGRMIGGYNRGEEKVVRFRAEYGKAEIDKFYSDSHSDAPLAKIAKKAFWVKGEKVTPWPKQN